MLTPLQSKLIQNSLWVKKHISKEMDITLGKFEKMVQIIISEQDINTDELKKEVQKNSKKIRKILWKKIDRTIMLKGFPRNWETILREKSQIYTARFRNKEFLDAKMEEIINALKEWKKFHTENNTSMMKVFSLLASEQAIIFTFIHGFWFVLDFKPNEFNEKAEFQSENFKKALCIVNSDSQEIYDKKTHLFYEFITHIVVKKLKSIFSIQEIQEYFEKNGYPESETIILTFLKKLKIRGPWVWIMIKNGKNGQLNYLFDFKSLVFWNFVKQYFPTDTREFEEKFDIVFQNYKNKDFASLLKKEILSKNSQSIFFKSRNFINTYGEDLYNRVALWLKALKDAWLVAIKWKDSYYIVSEVQKSSLNYEHIIEQFTIEWKISKIHINILNYILADIAHIIDLSGLWENDMHISIFADLKVIEITLHHQKLKEIKNKITYISDEIGEKFWYNIVMK